MDIIDDQFIFFFGIFEKDILGKINSIPLPNKQIDSVLDYLKRISSYESFVWNQVAQVALDGFDLLRIHRKNTFLI